MGLLGYYRSTTKIFHEQRTKSFSYCKQNLTVWPERCVKSKYRSVPSPQPFVWGKWHQKALEKLLDHLASAVRSIIYSTSWLDVWSLTWFFKNRQPPGRSSMIVRLTAWRLSPVAHLIGARWARKTQVLSGVEDTCCDWAEREPSCIWGQTWRTDC